MKDSQRVFQKMEDREVVSYSNKLITGFAVHGQGSEAIKLLSTMKEEGVKSMQPWRLLEEGQKVFESIETHL